MELENIVANTVLLKAREGKLTHTHTHTGAECTQLSRPGSVTFCARYAEKVGIIVVMTAVGSLRTVRLRPAGKSHRCN